MSGEYRAVQSLRDRIDDIMREFDPIPPHILEHLIYAYNWADAWMDSLDYDYGHEPKPEPKGGER